MSADLIDFAAVKAKHEAVSTSGGVLCRGCERDLRGAVAHPCLVYRLAVEAERLAGKVVEATTLTSGWGNTNTDDLDPLDMYERLARVLDLADEPEPIAHDDGAGFYRLDASTTGVG